MQMERHLNFEREKNNNANQLLNNWVWGQSSTQYKEHVKLIALDYPKETKKLLEAEKMAKDCHLFLSICKKDAKDSEIKVMRNEKEGMKIQIENMAKEEENKIKEKEKEISAKENEIKELSEECNTLRKKYMNLQDVIDSGNFAGSGSPAVGGGELERRLKETFEREIEKRTAVLKHEMENNKEEQMQTKQEQAKFNEEIDLKNKEMEIMLKQQAGELENQKTLKNELEILLEQQTNAILNMLEKVGKDEAEDSSNGRTIEDRILETIGQLHSDTKFVESSMTEKRMKEKERIEKIIEQRKKKRESQKLKNVEE